MFYVSEIYTCPPSEFKSELQKLTYQILNELNIPYQRVDTSKAITMEDCIGINERLDMDMVKTLFLANSTLDHFYIYVIKSNKKFKASAFSKQLNKNNIILAPKDLMLEKLHTEIGAATIFSAAIDKHKEISIVFDKEIYNSEYYGCSDATNYGFMKVKTKDIIDKFLPYTKHELYIIE